MKLIDLLEAIGEGYCSFDTAEIIQICEPNMDWDNFSEFHVGSQLLKPFVDFEVDCIGAIAENVIRVALYNEDFCGVKGYFPCKRMSSLFKDVYADGHVEYIDVSRFRCRTLDSSACWSNGHVSKIASEYFPITMPYIPRTYTVVCEEFLSDRKNGDFDTIGILYILDSAGDRKEVNRYFAEAEEGWREIYRVEYEQRRQMDAERRKEEEKKNENFAMQTDND